MNKVYTSSEFIARLKWLVNEVPNVYHSGKGWSELHDGKWWFDCVVSVKCILWGFKADKNLFRGGTKYCSNGVPDFTCNGALDYCTDVSQNFSDLVPGEYLCMKDTKYNHTGIYLGKGKVFEDTTAWGTKKAIISDIDSKGIRSYNGKKSLKWTYHGKMKWIDYTDQPQLINQVKLWQTYMNEQWHCGLVVDGSYGSKSKAEANKHQLHYLVKAPIMIQWLQQRLIELGYSVGKCGVDRSFGRDTESAVKKFQKDHGLKVDGWVGKNTVASLLK